jgi:hypothetical protein
MTALSPQTDDDRVIASIRANIVFEKMIVSALAVAGVAGAAHFAIGVGARAFGGALSLGAAGNAAFGAVSYACLFFLAGFATAAAVGIPLFKFLEQAKLRKAWPYALAAFSVSFLILAAIGLAPSFEAPARALYLAPGVAAAVDFGRKMRPFWRAAERAESSPAIVRLH